MVWSTWSIRVACLGRVHLPHCSAWSMTTPSADILNPGSASVCAWLRMAPEPRKIREKSKKRAEIEYIIANTSRLPFERSLAGT